MANSINATSTSNGGIITTGDDSGVLNIQTNETTAISIDASQSVDFTNNIDAPNTFGFKNRIINGNMVLDQRGTAGAPVAANNVYGLDRWLNVSDTSNKWTFQQNSGSVTPPTGFKYYLGAVSSSAYSPSSTDYFGPQQRIEGYNTADLGWGAAGAATVTLSFWVRSSLTGTFGGAVLNDGQDYNYPFSYTIGSANTWTYITVTIPGPTSGTWATTTSAGIKVFFSLGAGSSRVGTANTWTSTANVFAPTGSVNVISTNAATWYVTGVQLEKGTQATSFDFRSYGTELALCQRYYWQWQPGALYPAYSGVCSDGSNLFFNFAMPSAMRSAPTLTTSSPTNVTSPPSGNQFGVYVGGYKTCGTSFAIGAGNDTASVRVGNLTGVTAGQGMTMDTGAGFWLGFSSEL